MKIAVVGGGASGMMVCAFAMKNHEVTLFEKNSRVGKKLLVTGNGRCNLSNSNTGTEHYHGTDSAFCEYALKNYGMDKTREFFRSIGLLTVSDGDRIYPLSNSANSVVDSLRLYIANNGVDIKTDTEVKSVSKQDGKFILTADETYFFDRVVISAGGRAGKKYGGSDSGYRLLNNLGHDTTALFPSLVQLKTDNTYTKSLKGVRADAMVSVVENQQVVARSSGEIQFTEYGISGPAVFEISRCAVQANGGAVLLDLLQDYSRDEIVSILLEKQQLLKTETLENLLTGLLHNRLGRTVLRYCGYHLDEAIACLYREDIEDIADGIKNFELPLTGNLGFDNAQVTAGGILTEGFDAETLESKKVSGLYATGEVLDIDGDCGGFNLQWAWSSGMLVGQNI